MSDRALVAAMRPKSNGSSTMGMKKSVVATMACSSLRRYTAASSDVSLPTSRAAKLAAGAERFSNCASTPGAILQPQPPPCARSVRRGCAAAAVSGNEEEVCVRLAQLAQMMVVAVVLQVCGTRQLRDRRRRQRVQEFQLLALLAVTPGDRPADPVHRAQAL